MTITLHRANQYPKQRWSQGSTQQLLIHPPSSHFSAGDYQLRLSIATVEAQRSHFTALHGVHRRLMVLSGHQALVHEGRHSADLAPFEQDAFCAHWETHCRGCAVNFNLMTKGECESALEAVHLAPAQRLDIVQDAELGFRYLAKGAVKWGVEHLVAGDGVALQAGDRVTLESLEHSTLIVANYSSR
ncbi:MAG: HutD family protein [Pseudomonadales bacterium]